MKQAIYIFSMYIGVVTFYTLSYFRQTMEISLSASLLAMLITGGVIFALTGTKRNGNRLTFKYFWFFCIFLITLPV